MEGGRAALLEDDRAADTLLTHSGDKFKSKLYHR